MVKPQNLTVKGKCFLTSKSHNEIITEFKKLLRQYMYSLGYDVIGEINPFFDNPFLSITFRLHNPKEGVKPLLDFKKKLRLINEFKHFQEVYFHWLETKTNDTPWEVDFLLSPTNYNSISGIMIEIISKPAIIFKLNQLNIKY